MMNENDSNAEGLDEVQDSTESEQTTGTEQTVETEPIVATRGFDANRKPKEVVWGDGRRPSPDRVCTARRTNGQPCTRIAIAGGNVCPAHGGLAPHIQAKARARLQSAADRMAKELLKIAVSDAAPGNVKLAAIRDALDRAGLSAKTAVEVEVGPPKGFEQVLEAMVTGGSRAESRARRGLTDDAFSANPDDWTASEILDAQIVDDEAGYSPAPSHRPSTTPRPTQSPAPANGSGLLPFEEALDRLHNTPPPAQQPAPRRRTGH
ncbi:hypothetical protein BJF87_07705 [Gordonia sp. CNJ-863]|uniref:hypothetical protein n=1 Tax=Gordonia sp. CNJ-863 TaxID=1904963 RepID=UPI00095AFD74|nr:hypothetical protein [Gordonia sp. CNJ-863]OLT44471.1 hypothetical protein BJF87_07705 [Gordonia sp. CNJ-863]